MASQASVRLIEGTFMEGTIRGHTIPMDVPERLGGKDTAPSPTDVFIMSLSGCALFYAHQFLSRRGINTDGATADVEYEPGKQGIESIDIRISVPGGLSQELIQGAQKMIDACYVKETIQLPLRITTHIE